MDQGSHSSTNLSPKLLGPRCRRALQTTSGPEGHLQTTTMGGDAEHGISMGFVRARLVCKVMLDTFHSAMSSFQIAHRNAASRLDQRGCAIQYCGYVGMCDACPSK